MAVLDATNLTLLDLAKRTDPDGTISSIAEVLKEQNEILDDVSFVQGNLDTGHLATVRTGIPTATWSKLGERITPKKSTTAQITFNTGLLKEVAEVPKDILDISANPEQVLFTEEMAFLQGINQELSSTFFFGNEDTAPAEFTGLANYYNDTTAESGDNIIDAGGTGSDNASIYLIGWAPTTIHGIVPKNVPAGIQRDPIGFVDSENSDGIVRVHRTHLQLHAGLVVADWRYGVRIANIDRSNLKADASSGADLPELMFQAMEQIWSLEGVTPVFYMDRSIRTKVRQQLAAKVASSTLTFEDVGGRRTAMFQEVPIRRVDSLSADEAQVT